jgi:uncharacterized protein YdaU (DUF1376 family)
MTVANKYPWMPFYGSDFYDDTRHLSNEAKGAYLALLWHLWEHEQMQCNCTCICRIIGYNSSESIYNSFETLWGELSPFFQENGNGMLFNPRVKKELEKRQSVSKKRSEAAKMRHANAPANAYTSTSSINTSKEELKASKKRPKIDYSEQLQTWNRIASENNLPTLRKWTPERKVALKLRLEEEPDFWREVEAALSDRDPWYVKKQIGTFDQVTRPSFLVKLLEGNYNKKCDPKRELVEGDDGIWRRK